MKAERNKITRAALHTLAVAAIVAGASPLAPAASAQKLDDAGITDAIERQMLFDDAVPTNEIDVVCTDGVVTLTGSVDALLQRERAVRLAETVKGVRAVVDRIRVQPSVMRTDIEVQRDVEMALLTDPAADSYEITATAHDGKVTLTGVVDSWAEKQLAGRVAAGVRGVTDLDNELAITYRSERPDAEIRSEVDETLRWDALVDAGLVDVSVDGGAVKLSGTVGSAAEKRRAISDAWTAGVKSVDASKLDVARWARDEDLREEPASMTDADIRRAVESAMAIDPRVDSFVVRTSVDQGLATLAGTVDNLEAKRAAARDAHNTVGVRAVRNQIKVRPPEERSDASIADGVLAKLLADPEYTHHEIAVSVHDGVAYLDGTVDSIYEKALADDLAARVDGVKRVVNRLGVEGRPYAYDPYVDDWFVYDYDWYRPVPLKTWRSDWEIKRSIEDELWWSPYVDSDEITVSVEDGVATLTGTVDSWMEDGAAVDNAYEGGATYVRDRLVVEEAGAPRIGRAETKR